MNIEDYENPKITPNRLLKKIHSMLCVACLISWLHPFLMSLFIGFVLTSPVFELLGYFRNRELGKVHFYRPLSGLTCLFIGHKWVVNEEWLSIKDAMLSCTRCGDNAFVSLKRLNFLG